VDHRVAAIIPLIRSSAEKAEIVSGIFGYFQRLFRRVSRRLMTPCDPCSGVVGMGSDLPQSFDQARNAT
jgi:hypothetical protein